MPSSRGAWLVPSALFLLLAAVPPAARAEETILFFRRLSQTITLRPASQGGNALTDSSETEIVVALGDHRVVAYDTRQVWVYDFPRRRVLNVNVEKKIYSDWSLHAYVALKEMEMASRMGERSRMMAGRAGPGPSVLDIESLFSMKSKVTPAKGDVLADSSRGGRVRIFVHGDLAMESALTDTAFAPGRAAMFGRFLGLQAQLHPAARERLVRSGRVPRRLYYRYRDYNDETQVVFELVRVASAPEGNDPTANASRMDVPEPGPTELNRLLNARRSCAAHGDWHQASRAYEAAALDSMRLHEAALAAAERALGACEPLAPWPPEIEARADSVVAAIRAGIAWRDSAGAWSALRRLERLNARAIANGYVLDYIRGRARVAVGDLDGGSRLLIGALSRNPCMEGCWLSLAEAYLRGLEPVLAWICMDAAREGKGGCEALMASQAKLERGLEARFPEFFE